MTRGGQHADHARMISRPRQPKSGYSHPRVSSHGADARWPPSISILALSMRTTLRQLRGRLATSPNRIAFAWALRGTIATGLPLIALPALGLGPLSNFVVIGALNTSMVDVGGSYRSRLTAMALNAVVSPMALLLGNFARDNGWIAAALMLLVAFASGLMRALGPAGVSLRDGTGSGSWLCRPGCIR